MRVTNGATYRNFTTGANSVHAQLIKSYNKVSSGEAYEKASDSPLNYYNSQKIDSRYQDVIGKQALIKDVQNRIYQQELGARDVQSILSKAKDQIIYANTDTTNDTPLLSLRDDLLQKEHEIVNALNMQYQNFYVFGGNDISTPPFALSGDGTTITYTHTFPGASKPTTFEMKLEETKPYPDADPTEYGFSLKVTTPDNTTFEYDPKNPPADPTDPNDQGNQAQALLLKAMKEQGRMDVGYGSIRDHDTLIDTYTGGVNLLTGLTSDAVKGGAGNLCSKDAAGNPLATDSSGKSIMDYLNESPLALISRSVQAIDKYVGDADNPDRDRTELNHLLSQTITDMVTTEHRVSAVYSDLGNKYRLLEDTTDKLSLEKNNLTEQYTDVWGADPYKAIVEMYNSQQAYNAALKVGTNLMSSSLFDFMR